MSQPPTSLRGAKYLDNNLTHPEKRSQLSLLWAVRDGATTEGSARAVLTQLILRANKRKKWTCYPALTQIAEDTCLDRSTVIRALDKLADAGLIKRTRRKKTSTLYWVQYEQIEALASEALLKAAAAKAEDAAYDDPHPGSEAYEEEEEWKL